MNEMVIGMLRLALNAMAERIAIFLSLAMMFALACWCMYDPTTQRLILVAIFGALVFLPILSKYDAPKRVDTPRVQPEA